MNSETMTKKRLVDILSHKNWREWFQLIELYFAREELDFVLHQTEEEYYTIIGFIAQSESSTSRSTPNIDRIDEIGKSLSGLSLGGKRKPKTRS